MAKRSLFNRVAITLVALVLLCAVGICGAILVLSEPLPKGEAGPAADALAHAIESATRKEAWDRTQAVTWLFAGRNRHLWDRRRMYDRVTFGQYEVLVDLTNQTGVALRNGLPVTSSQRDKLVRKAYANYINDSFWLNPLSKLFDEGVIRQLLTMPDGSNALLVSYTIGGLTPGDSYLWLLDAAHLPRKKKLWVSILPLKGIAFTDEDWIELRTGAKISTLHKSSLFTLRLSDVKGAATLDELVPGPDPFAALVAGQAR